MPSAGNDNPRVRVGAATGLAVLAAVAAAPADASPARDTLVRPGQGIGRVSLGMTQQQVRARLGRHMAVAERRRLGFGQQYLELQWAYAAWTVGFEGRASSLRVVKVATTLRGQRTRARLGTGSRVRDIVRVYPQATCSDWPGIHTDSSVGRWIVVAHPNGTRTIFTALGEGLATPRPLRVVEVMVQRPSRGLAEQRRPCGPNWRNQ
jgi:hypothetical protein